MAYDEPSPTQPGDSTRPLSQNRGGGGERIGPYRLLEKIGEGGMGEVYLAEQEEPVRRRVALKVIKHGMDTKEVVARFEAERQALAMMDHPNIARVYDAGQTPRGRPYFVMEYVPGVPINEYCDRHRLGTIQRLELLLDVCAGVQHAHQKAIIHRDLKPTNVLVTVQDDKPVPKIIDFGVAKAIHQRLTERTMFTELGQLIGTPEYMSPEQAEGSELDVDIRTDVYSLGVILYELLTGTLPFEPETLRRAGYAEIQRILREEEPARPSTRITKTGERMSDIAHRRRTEPSRLVKQVRGDLDWIVLKSLEKDRTRRYAGVNELSQDLQRHMEDRPVLAGPPGVGYRLGKFARRNRVGIIAGGAVAMGVLVGAIGLTLALLESNKQRERIAAALNEAEQARDESEAVTGFLVDMLAAADPGVEGRDVMVRELLDQAAWSVDNEFGDRPEVQGRLQRTLGTTYTALGRYDEAEDQLSHALRIQREHAGETGLPTLDTMEKLSHLRRQQGDYAASSSLMTHVIEARREALGESDPATIAAMNSLAAAHADAGEYALAESLSLASMELRRATGDEGLGLARNLEGLASIYHFQARYDEAEPLYREALAIEAELLGSDHPATLTTMGNIGGLLSESSRYAEAESVIVQNLEIRRRVLGDEHPITLRVMNGLGMIYDNWGKPDRAEPIYIEALALKRKLLGTDHPSTLSSVNNLAVLYTKQERYEDAGIMFAEVIDVGSRVFGPEHPRVLSTKGNLAYVYARGGRYEDAERLYLEALAAQLESLGEKHPNVLVMKGNLGELYSEQGQYVRAEPILAEAVGYAKEGALPPGHWMTGSLMRVHGSCLIGLGRYSEAETELLGAHEMMAGTLGDEHRRTQQAVGALVELYEAWGRDVDAESWAVRRADTGR